ncbi:extradiol dioxygenase [Janthinobacterium sp. ROICE36]|uniref:VOC family protein n=1 Tax=Janthinobacterium sp. ROICE36 TaxID=2048670 RepID=UPI000C7F0A0B|nr:VOC family protein [Janthinobacterium sp. ROICE36]PLY40145.1 extradiol dioxygenase [Janthinobacterium sp. ROICE36]
MKMQCTGKLNHLSLPTADPTATAVFLEKYFGCEIVTAGKNILLKHDGIDIVLDGTTAKSDWPANFHFGFEVETLQQVEQLHEAFYQEGVHMETEVFNNSRGSRFFCRTPEGVMIEVNTREDKQDDWRMLF